MANFLTPAAYRANEALRKSGIQIQHSTLLEVLSALLGYESFKVLEQEEGDGHPGLHLHDADFHILNVAFGDACAFSLCDRSTEVVTHCIAALEETVGVPVFRDLAGFYSKRGRECAAALLDDYDVLRKLLGSEWNLHGKLIINDRFSCDESVWDANPIWRMRAVAAWSTDEATPRKWTELALSLAFKKSGRSGLVHIINTDVDSRNNASIANDGSLRGTEAALEFFRSDMLVQMDDGSTDRPWVAVLFHLKTRTVMGIAFTLDGNLDRMAIRATTDAINRGRFDPSRSEMNPGWVGSIALDNGNEFSSRAFRRLCAEHRITIDHVNNRQMGGRVERVFIALNTWLERALTPEEFERYLFRAIARFSLR
jgi:transposase InsO family protein